jgi:hypothetical protein
MFFSFYFEKKNKHFLIRFLQTKFIYKMTNREKEKIIFRQLHQELEDEIAEIDLAKFASSLERIN